MVNTLFILLAVSITAILFSGFKVKRIVAIGTVIIISALTGITAVQSLIGPAYEVIMAGTELFGNIPVRIDGLSAWFILVINITAVTGVIYGSGYLKTEGIQSHLITSHWILYIIFHSSMLLVSMVQNSVAFIVLWEIMSISSFLLILFDYTNPRVIKAGINYLVQMHISVILLTIGFIWAYFETGTFDFRGIEEFFGVNRNIWLFLFFFIGFGIKSGFIGFHTWLPLAHPAAPSHISGVMSGVIVKMGIYGMFRIICFLKSDFLLIGEIVIIASLLTGVFGIMNAAVHRDFKRMLAYCTIENIGIIGIGMGVGLIGMSNGNNLMVLLGFGGALLHVLNHSLFKSLLFFSAGSVYRQTHTRDMDRLGGMIKLMPRTAIMFLIGAVAIGGIPPLNGFVSEFLIYSGILQGISDDSVARIILLIVTFAGISLIGGISILTFTKAFGTIFLGTPRQVEVNEVREVSNLMLVPQYIIAALIIVIGLFPGFFLNIVATILGRGLLPEVDMTGIQHYTAILNNIALASVLFIIITALIFAFRHLSLKHREEDISPTWGCGYTAPDAKMQYTGKSFSKSFGKLLNFILIEKKVYDEIREDETFPSRRKYNSFYLDFFEARLIDPALKILNRFFNIFQFIQNGRIQAYVLYGIIFIIAIFIGTLFNFLP